MMAKIRTAVPIIAMLLVAGGLGLLHGQTDDSAPPLLSEPDLEQLVAPIALYPDPLVAIILPASTVPTDIVLADRYVQNGGDPDNIDAQNWDDSVKALARYPDVLKMMDDNLDWTNQLGAAVLAQQSDVMAAIQSQRAKAEALGNLETNSQQQVITDGGFIQIIPADPQVIYVPVYDPQVIYVDRGPNLINFGLGFAIGAWLGGDCDWHNHYIYRGGYYRAGYGWHRPGNVVTRPPVWRPNPGKPKPRPPYRPGKPGGGGSHGQLPGWHRPPGKPGSPNKPPSGGNRPGQPGNRPGQPGNRPGSDRPQIQPVPNPGQGSKPSPNRPGMMRPSPGSDHQKSTPNRPARPQIQPTPKPQVQPSRPTTRPTAPSVNRPAFNRDKPNTKRPEHQGTPARAQRPAPAKSAPAHRPAPAKSDKKR